MSIFGGLARRRPDQYPRGVGGVLPAPQNNVVIGRFVVVATAGGGIFVYSPTAGAGNLIASVAPANGTDPYGNAYKAGITSYLPGSVLSQLVTGAVILSSANPATRISFGGHLLLTDATIDSATPEMEVKAPTTSAGNAGSVQLLGQSKDLSKPAQVLIGPATLNPLTTADVELQGAVNLPSGDLDISGAGHGLKVKEGANARLGTATLVAGTVTIANTTVGVSTRVLYARSVAGGTLGHLSRTIVAGTSFTINSSSNLDTSQVAWMLVDPG